MQKKSSKLLLSIFSLLLLLSLVANPVFAQSEDGFEETFDDPNLPEWEHSAEVIASDGTLKMNPGSFALRFGDWQNIDMTIKVKKISQGEIIVGYNFRDDTAYFLHFNGDEIVLERLSAGTPAVLGQANLNSISVGTWFSLNISVSDGIQKISIDNSPLLEITDPSPLSPGAFMLQCHGESNCEFDDFIVKGSVGFSEVLPENEGETPPQEEMPMQEVPEPGNEQPILQSAVESDTKTSLAEEFFSSQSNTLELTTFVINLVLAALTSFILSQVYIHWGSSLSNRRKFAQNFMLVTISTTFIILVVRSSIALSLGLVGALSIIRFRTAIKDPEELAYLFFAIGLGIGLGDNQRLVTMLALSVAVIILGLMKIFRQSRADINFHLIIGNSGTIKISPDEILEILKKHCSKWQLMRLDETTQHIEMAFLVEFKKLADFTAAKNTLNTLSDTLEISFLDNKGLE
ncbi:MAG: DUF4956 domain-containing protein [Anaerolineaceae bacterium]|nr:DUF4956 domain-containing protein [Anaerolineaceae bacterium]